MDKKQKKERTLQDFVNILLPKLWIIALTAVVCAMALFTYSFTKQDTYTSSANFLLNINASDSNTKVNEPVIASNTIAKYENMVAGDEFFENVRLAVSADPMCNMEITKSQFKSMFKFSGKENQTFSFSITHTDRNAAFNIANVVSQCLQDSIQKMSGNNSNETIEVISAPQPPSSANSKNSVRNALIAFLAGAIVSAAVVLIIALSDVTIRDKKKIEDNFNIPILGVIPYHDINSGSGQNVYGGQY